MGRVHKGLIEEWIYKLKNSTVTQADLTVLSGVNASAAEINNAADVSARVQTLTASTASQAITAGVQSVQLNGSTATITATIASLANHPGLFAIVDTSTGGTQSHTVTLTAGTFSSTGANKVTLNAPGESIIFYVDSSGDGQLLNNNGSVALATV